MRRQSAVIVAILVLTAALGVGVGGATGSADAALADDDCGFPVTMTDNTGTEVAVDEEPETVVTLNPSAAQTMWEIGAEEKVIGVTKHAMNLEGTDERTNVSVASETIDVETVVDLDPDLVLAPNVVSEETVEKLREAGLTVYHFPMEGSIEDVYQKTNTIGALVGDCQSAHETVDRMQGEIEIVENASDGEERPDALYVFYGYTAGEGTFIHEIITAAGANNVAAEANITGYQQVNEELVVDEDPDWIILNSDDDQVPDSEAYDSTTAVREDQIVVVNKNYLNRPAPRITNAIVKLAKSFHADAYEAALADATATSTVESTPTLTDGPETTQTESAATQSDEQTSATPEETGATDAETPGFGPVAALAALLIAFLAVGGRTVISEDERDP
jgi:iron complex transport system substrate-binding protein